MTHQNFHDRDGFIWMDGKMLPWRDAQVHYLTHALHYGTLVFEGERAYEGKIFKSVQHSERLLFSAAEIYIQDIPWEIEELEAAKQTILKENKLENAYIRAAIWRGSDTMGIDVTGSKPRVAIAAWEWGSYFDPDIKKNGISLRSSNWRKPAPNTAPTRAKTASLYNLGCMAKYEAQQAGYTDALMLDHEGFVAESTGSNLFAVQDGTLITPIADRFLNGLTRQTAMKLAESMGIPVEERRIKPEEITGFDEIFVTGTAAEITPVGKIDDHHYGVGPVTQKIHAAYEDLVRS